MTCECINTAIFMENENERLRSRIKHIEKKSQKIPKGVTGFIQQRF